MALGIDSVIPEYLPQLANYVPPNMKRLENTLYERLIIDHVINPYLGKIDNPHNRIKSLVFRPAERNYEFDYCRLIFLCGDNKEWWGLIIDRLARCYPYIDFSIFPNEAFAEALKKALIFNGVKAIKRFDNAIYAAF